MKTGQTLSVSGYSVARIFQKELLTLVGGRGRRETDRQTETDRERERQTDRDRQRETETETEKAADKPDRLVDVPINFSCTHIYFVP